ncbi:MAG: type II and III secretion system family protein [Alphaproteobacteria bacterium]|nr:type II and III secretion system family protein [Alphaproteobacteria bacterium]
MIYQYATGLRSLHLLVACVLLFGLTTAGCDVSKNHLKPDRDAGMEMQDFRDGLAPRIPDPAESASLDSASSIPPLQPYVAESAGFGKSMPLVSISVNQSVPLRDILFELAQQADYDLELDPGIRGSIIFTAREKPFDQVIQRICDAAGLRYRFQDDVLRVEVDAPYNKTYKVDYLSYIRSNTGSVRNDVGVVSGDGADTGSSFEAKSSSEANFWGEMEANLNQILAQGGSNGLRTRNDPRLVATQQSAGADGQEAGSLLKVESLPVDGDEEQSPATGTESGFKFSMNRQAGLINVYASEKVQKEVDRYLTVLRRSSTAQVLIEAKIMEVSLNDEFITGIDWRALDISSGEVALNYLSSTGSAVLSGLGPSTAPAPGGSVATSSNFVVGYAGDDVQAVIQAISGFGTVRALASPRLTVLNNQSAVLNVATNQVFFEVSIDVTQDEGTVNTNVDSKIRNVPEGVLVNVQPSINLDTGTVAMAIRPTITQVVSEVSDPAVQFVTASAGITGVESLVPELNVQEIDSVIQVRSGQPIIMGGLLQDKIRTNEEGVPVLSEVPVFGSLFRKHSDYARKTELVIFLKATILEAPGDSVHDTDRDLYRSFSGDRRPLKL